MGTDTLGHLKSAREFVESAEAQVSQAKNDPVFTNNLIRQAALEEIKRIRLALSITRHNLVPIARLANRRPPTR
jgi:hypothetical protein